jgi:hypothetical protein
MKLRAFDVAFRAVQRGYTLDELRPCLTQNLGDGYFEVDVDHAAYPRVARDGYTMPTGAMDVVKEMLVELGISNPDPPVRPGLGDMVAAGLNAVGITKERVSAIVGGPCGCDKRQAALNDLGRKFGIG